jgi:hypothetical protein
MLRLKTPLRHSLPTRVVKCEPHALEVAAMIEFRVPSVIDAASAKTRVYGRRHPDIVGRGKSTVGKRVRVLGQDLDDELECVLGMQNPIPLLFGTVLLLLYRPDRFLNRFAREGSVLIWATIYLADQTCYVGQRDRPAGSGVNVYRHFKAGGSSYG